MDSIYMNIIDAKFKGSNDHYKKIFKDEKPIVFLYHFDEMNVYPLFPSPLSLSLEKNNDDVNNITIGGKTTIKYDNKLRKLLDERIIEANTEDKIKKTDDKIRKFFSYEVVDHVAAHYNAEYVTTAWLKCYEIITYYELINKLDEVNYFGICEQPGAFCYAINHYVKTNYPGTKFNFVLQSLINPHNDKVFKPEKTLSSKYPGSYDYGYDKVGDVTNIENLKYYRKKYYNRKFDIISADCGEDCSDDFTQQEKKLLPVIMGQLILAIGLADKGSNYFFKMFTIHEEASASSLYLLTFLFEDVIISRVLMTKPNSGEIYVVCRNFKFHKKETDGLMEKLFDAYEKKNYSLMSINSDKFINMLTTYNEVLTKRRIISLNFFIFRANNIAYVDSHDIIKQHIMNLVNHYVVYFCDFYEIKSLENKLVNKIFTNKWIQSKKAYSNIFNINDVMMKLYDTDNYEVMLKGKVSYIEYIPQKLNHKPSLSKSYCENFLLQKSYDISRNITTILEYKFRQFSHLYYGCGNYYFRKNVISFINNIKHYDDVNISTFSKQVYVGAQEEHKKLCNKLKITYGEYHFKPLEVNTLKRVNNALRNVSVSGIYEFSKNDHIQVYINIMKMINSDVNGSSYLINFRVEFIDTIFDLLNEMALGFESSHIIVNSFTNEFYGFWGLFVNKKSNVNVPNNNITRLYDKDLLTGKYFDFIKQIIEYRTNYFGMISLLLELELYDKEKYNALVEKNKIIIDYHNHSK